MSASLSLATCRDRLVTLDDLGFKSLDDDAAGGHDAVPIQWYALTEPLVRATLVEVAGREIGPVGLTVDLTGAICLQVDYCNLHYLRTS